MKVGCIHPYVVNKGRFHIDPCGNIVNDELHLPCGKCEYCLQRRQKDWSLRLNIEYEYSFNSVFLTLTYNNENLPKHKGIPTLCYTDVQLFVKRFREFFSRKYPNSAPIRFYLCGEYGPRTLRPHYHILFFNIPDLRHFTERVRRLWKKGFVEWKKPARDHFNYLTTYINYNDSRLLSLINSKKIQPPFRRMSLRKAIGYQYLERSNRITWHRNTLTTYIQLHGFKYAMPRYYYDRIFDCEETRLELRKRSEAYFDKQSEEYFELYGHDDSLRIASGRPTNFEEAVQSFLYNYYRKLNRQKYHRQI
ncbi:MAG: hypothetical protein QXL01_06910 [Thermoplasmatales archaeon]